MPPLPPIPHCARSIYRGDFSGLPFSTGLTWHYAGVWTPSEVQDVNVLLINAWVGDLNPVLAASFEIQEVETIDLSSAATPIEITSGGGHGTSGFTSLPFNDTFDVYWPAGSRYRGGKCHSFLAGFTTPSLSGSANTWSGTLIAAAQAWATAVHAALNAVGAHPGLGALQHGTVHYRGPVALGPYPRFEAVADPVMSPKVHGRTRRLGR